MQITDHDGQGHGPGSNRRRVSYWTALMLAGLLVVVIGVQAFLAQRDNARRDARDADYAECLTQFSTDLVETIKTRVMASAGLEKAAARKDAALDNLLAVVLEAQRGKGYGEDFRRALEERVAAQLAYRDLAREVDQVRDMNEYQSPEVVCER